MKQPGHIHLIKQYKGVFQNFVNLGFIQFSNIAIQLLLFPLILRIIGIEAFGLVSVINAYSLLAGVFINYGTNQSGIKDIAIARDNPTKLSTIFFDILQTRFFLFLIIVAFIVAGYIIEVPYIHYVIFATPLIFAEAINPIFFFTGIEKLTVYNSANFLAKLCSALLIILFIHQETGAWWVNFFLGIANTFFYGLILVYAIYSNQLKWRSISVSSIKQLLQKNSFLLATNITSHIQQSTFLFLLPIFSSPLILGAYSVCDKIIASVRMLIIAFTFAIYPKAAISYEQNKDEWSRFKTQINRFLAIGFILGGLLIWFGSNFIVELLTGSENELAAGYLKTVAIVPFFMALNTLNVVELLINNQYQVLLYCSLSLLLFAACFASLFLTYNQPAYFGFYALLIEISSICITLFFLSKKMRGLLWQ